MNLIEFLSKYGVRSTSNFNLKDIFNDLNINGKVLMRDELSKIKSTKKNNIIMNLQTSKDSGSHWVCVYKSCDTDQRSNNYYFDPYGILPTKEVYDFLKDQSFYYNKLQIQQEGMECCGQLSLYVLYKLNNTKEDLSIDSFENIILGMKKEIDLLIK